MSSNARTAATQKLRLKVRITAKPTTINCRNLNMNFDGVLSKTNRIGMAIKATRTRDCPGGRIRVTPGSPAPDVKRVSTRPGNIFVTSPRKYCAIINRATSVARIKIPFSSLRKCFSSQIKFVTIKKVRYKLTVRTSPRLWLIVTVELTMAMTVESKATPQNARRGQLREVCSSRNRGHSSRV